MCRLITIVVSFALLALTRCDAQGNIFKRDTNNVNIISVGFNQWPQKTQWKHLDYFLKLHSHLYSINFLKGRRNKNIYIKIALNGNFGTFDGIYSITKAHSFSPEIGVRYQKKIREKIPIFFYTDLFILYSNSCAENKNKVSLTQSTTTLTSFGGGLYLGLNYSFKDIFIGCDLGLSAVNTKHIYNSSSLNINDTFFSIRVNSLFGLKFGLKIN